MPVIQSTLESVIVRWNNDVFQESQIIYYQAMENIFKKLTVPLESHEFKVNYKFLFTPVGLRTSFTKMQTTTKNS